jgi:Ca2+-transporting ATPase
MTTDTFNFKGLNDNEVIESRLKNGKNLLTLKDENHFWNSIYQFIKDPMILLLLVASILYFISGKTSDALFLIGAIILISSISSYQNARSRNALTKLKDYTKPNCKVIRFGHWR